MDDRLRAEAQPVRASLVEAIGTIGVFIEDHPHHPDVDRLRHIKESMSMYLFAPPHTGDTP